MGAISDICAATPIEHLCYQGWSITFTKVCVCVVCPSGCYCKKVLKSVITALRYGVCIKCPFV